MTETVSLGAFVVSIGLPALFVYSLLRTGSPHEAYLKTVGALAVVWVASELVTHLVVTAEVL